MERLEGRTAFVTGGASGIGLAIAKSLVDAGVRVVMADIDGAELARQAAPLGDAAATFTLDVTDRVRWPLAKAFVEERFGPLDILVNNAGIGPDLQLLADMAPESFDRLVAIKLTGVFNGVHTFAPGLRERGDGHIVNTSSMAGLSISRRLGAYTAAMFGVVGLSEVLRVEMAPHGVGVSVLCPGLVATRLSETTEAITGRPRFPPAASRAISASRAALDPSVVGETVVAAIRENRLYIVTHGEYRELIEARMQAQLDAFDAAPSH